MDCLVYLLGLACFSASGNQQAKQLLGKATNGDDFQISLQIFCTTLCKIFGKLVFKSAPLKACAFLPWQEQNGLLWGLHSPVLGALWISVKITIWNLEICHPSSWGEPCSLLLIPMDVVPWKATRPETSPILISRASPMGLKSKAVAAARCPSCSEEPKAVEHFAQCTMLES